METPTTTRQLQRCLSIFRTYRDLIPDFDSLAQPLLDHSCPDWIWPATADYAFRTLKREFHNHLNGAARVAVPTDDDTPSIAYCSYHDFLDHFGLQASLLCNGRMPTPTCYEELDLADRIFRRHRYIIGTASYEELSQPLFTILGYWRRPFRWDTVHDIAYHRLCKEFYNTLRGVDESRPADRQIRAINPNIAPSTPLAMVTLQTPHPSSEVHCFSGTTFMSRAPADVRSDSYRPSLDETWVCARDLVSLIKEARGARPVAATSSPATYRSAKRYPTTFAPPASPYGRDTGGPYKTTPARVNSSHPRHASHSPSSPAVIRVRPASFILENGPPEPSRAEYEVLLNHHSRLRYLLQPADRPAQCLALLLNDQLVVPQRVFIDDGSSICLCTARTCRELGIPILPTNLSLTTSNAIGTSVVGCTPMVQLVYGPGDPNCVRVWHSFLVTDLDSVYSILLGNLDMQTYMGRIDGADHSFTLRPQWSSLGPRSPVLTLPTFFAAPQAVRPRGGHR